MIDLLGWALVVAMLLVMIVGCMGILAMMLSMLIDVISEMVDKTCR